MRPVAVLVLSLVLLLPGMIVPAAKTLGYPVNTEALHHLIEGEPQVDTVFGVAEADSDFHAGFSIDPSQCTHAHMVMAAIPTTAPALRHVRRRGAQPTPPTADTSRRTRHPNDVTSGDVMATWPPLTWRCPRGRIHSEEVRKEWSGVVEWRWRQRQRDRDRGTERERETEGQRERDRGTERERDRDRDTDRQ